MGDVVGNMQSTARYASVLGTEFTNITSGVGSAAKPNGASIEKNRPEERFQENESISSRKSGSMFEERVET